MYKRIPIYPSNQRVIDMKALCSQYPDIVYRDVRELFMGVPSFFEIRDQFQIGYLPTLRYISFNRIKCNPTNHWIEGFISAAKQNKKYYREYMFFE